ncbi:MAG: flagellar assembly protein FliX [Pseudolabrys sp.]|nr:flagellar assembly protein FliX [Pseudolabrys sp.]MDP2295167.1 flagellar assembly protein FliX [Pseudolabrys sp.]
MRIYGTNGAGLSAKASGVRRAASGTFSVSEQEAPHNTAAAPSLRSISSLDSLMALQGIEGPAERKKRAVAKGRRALDVLDDLKIGLLDGSVDGSTMARLKVAADGLAEETGDPGLDAVMGEIGLRVAVEIAKAGIRQP